MRSSFFATLLTIVCLLSSGCRNASSVNTAGPLTPIGPLSPNGALSPLGTGQSPSLGPFGGSTRVTPPPTGSYVAPNNYMGGVVPGGSASFNGAGGSITNPNNVIGSGVQVAGWTDANTANQAFAPGSAGAAGFGTNPSTATGPRTGGMQVIDLTGAPPPPGYQPNYQPGYQPNYQPNYQPGYQPNYQPGYQPNYQPGYQPNYQPPQGFQPPSGSLPNSSQQDWGGLRAITAPNAGEIASGLRPVPTGDFPRTATAPTTEPLHSSQGPQDNLPWRRPR